MKPAATAWIGGGDKARKDQKSRAASKPRLATVLLGMPSLLALTLVVAKAAYTPRVHVVKETVIPGYVRLAPEAVDMRLNWTSVSTDAYQGVLINPSFLANPADGGASILRAARVHSLSLSYRTLYTDEKYKPFSYAYYNDENDDNVDDLDDYDDEYYDDSEYYDEYYDDGDDGEGCWDDCASCQPAIQGDCLDDCEMSWEDNDAIQYCCFEFEDDAYPGDDFDPSDSDMCANSDAYDELTDSRRRLDELPGFDRSLCPFTAGSFGTTFACDAITHDAGNSLLWAYDDDEEKAFVLHIWNTDLGFAISFQDDNSKLKLLMVDASDDVDCDLSTCDAFLDDFDDEASICDEYEADKCKVDSDCTVTTTSSSAGGARAEQWYDSCATTCGWEIPYNGYQALEYGNVTEIVYQWNSSIVLGTAPMGDWTADFDHAADWNLDGVVASDGLSTLAPYLLSPLDDTLVASVELATAAKLAFEDLASLSYYYGTEPRWEGLCEPAGVFFAENTSIVRKTVSGPEDPKLVALPGSTTHGGNEWGIAFSSFLPSAIALDKEKCDSAATVEMYFASNGPSLLKGAEEYSEQLAEGKSTPGGLSIATAPGVSLRGCGHDDGVNEKNWIAFTRRDQLYFVYSVEPHVVVLVRPVDGACVKRDEWNTKFNALTKLAEQVDIHGSGTALPYPGDELLVSSGSGRFVALAHTVDGEGRYSTFAYTFQARPPFQVMSVSRPLELQGGSNAFASALWLPPYSNKIDAKVVIGYGVSNAESRALVVSMDYFEELFVWCA